MAVDMPISNFLYENKAMRIIASAIGLNRARRGGNKIIGLYNPLRLKSSIRLYGSGNTLSLGTGTLYQTDIFIEGIDNEIRIGDDFRIRDTQIWIKGDNCKILLGKNHVINNAELGAENSGSSLISGDDTQIGGFVWLKDRANRTQPVSVYAGEGCLVQIGRNTRIAESSVIKNYDSHAIYNKTTDEILNTAKDVVIGDNVWVCPGSLILKGGGAGNGSIVGSRCVLTKDFSAFNHILLVGSPAKIAKEDVCWRL